MLYFAPDLVFNESVSFFFTSALLLFACFLLCPTPICVLHCCLLSHSIFFFCPFACLVNVLIHLSSHSFSFISPRQPFLYLIPSLYLSLSPGQVYIFYFMHTIRISSWILSRFIYNILLAYYGVEDLCHKHNPRRDWIFWGAHMLSMAFSPLSEIEDFLNAFWAISLHYCWQNSCIRHEIHFI